MWSSDLSTVAKVVCLHYSHNTWFHKKHHSRPSFFSLTLSWEEEHWESTVIWPSLQFQHLPTSHSLQGGISLLEGDWLEPQRAVHGCAIALSCVRELCCFLSDALEKSAPLLQDKALCTSRAQHWPHGACSPAQNTLVPLKLYDGHLLSTIYVGSACREQQSFRWNRFFSLSKKAEILVGHEMEKSCLL